MMDRNFLESLPYDLCWAVFSRLMGKEEAQVAADSRSWGDFWNPEDYLVFDQRRYSKCDVEKFIELVNEEIERYETEESRKDGCIIFTKLPSVASQIMKKNLVKNFSLVYLMPSSFVIPKEFRLSNILERVCLSSCTIRWKINWPQLTYLRLCSVYMYIRYDGDIVSYICGRCPLLMELEISDSYLCKCGDSFSRKNAIFGKLKSLSLVKMMNKFSGSFFTNFSSTFPSLEDLTIRHCDFLEMETEIAHHSVKNIILEHKRCVNAVFDVPSIKNFTFIGGVVIPKLSLKPINGAWKSHVTIILNGFQYSWFRQLHTLLKTTFIESTINLSMVLGHITGKKKNKMIPADVFLTMPVLLETLAIGVGSSCIPSNTIDALFCYFHPRFIYQIWVPSPPLVRATVEESIKFRELICRTLMPEGDDDRLLSLHDLVGVQVEKRKDSGDIESLSMNMISDVMAQVFDAKIRFKLQWAPEKAD